MAETSEKTSRFRFIMVQRTKSLEGNRRAIELADADARSHAARVSQELKKTKKKNELLKRKIAPNRKLEVLGPASMRLATAACQPVACVSSCLLDPFVQLPIELSFEERNLLHDYLTVVPQSLYHTTGRSAFCPVRDTTLISIATNEIWLSWAILLMQHRRSILLGRRPDEDPRLLHRRRLTYKLMNAKLAAPEEDTLSDETLYGIVAAGVAEHRVSGSKEANKHLKAGLTLWEMRRKNGMRQQITYPIGLVFCNAYIGIGVENFFKHYVTLVTTGSAMARRLKSMQTWNRELRQLVSDSRHRPEIAGEKPVLGHPSEEWLKARGLVCAKDSIIQGHVRQMLDDKSDVGTRTCLGALFAMNTTLWACRYNESEAIGFIEQLLHYLVKSEPGPVLDGRPQLTNMAAMYIVGFCGSNVQQRYGTSRTRFNLWDVIRFVELMMLTRVSSQDRMKSALASWLLVDVDNPEELILWSDEERDGMITEVEGAWGQKQFGLVDRGIRDYDGNS